MHICSGSERWRSGLLLLACAGLACSEEPASTQRKKPPTQTLGNAGAGGAVAVSAGGSGVAQGGAPALGADAGAAPVSPCGVDGLACMPPPMGTCEGAACDCEIDGTYVVRMKTRVHWDQVGAVGQVAIAAGQAELTSWGIWTLAREGDGLRATTRGCGGEAPDVCSPYFKQAFTQGITDTAWDRGTIPPDTWELGASGAHFISGTHAALLGVQLAGDPLAAFPPSYDSAGLQWMDDDGDGHPGVTVAVHPPGEQSVACGLPYAYLPIEQSIRPDRASHVFTGARSLQTIDILVEQCDVLTGSMTTQSTEARVTGCLRDNGEPCSTSQIEFLDRQPQSQKVDGGAFVLVRVAAPPASCAEVRAFPFP